jgi:putative ABC transport system permease protein
MLLNFITIAYRNLLHHKVFSFINIVGLAFGIAASLLLLNYISYELSYDKFHAKADSIYRIQHDVYKGGALENSSAISYYGAAPAIKESFPEVSNYVRLHRADGMMNYYTEKGEVISHHENKAFYTDSSFFSIFSFPLIKGDVNKILRSPSSLLLSESAAKKYFGKENPIGKTISVTTQWEGGQYVVEGVFKDIPENSHIQFDFLFSIENLLINTQFKNGAWYWTNFYTYLVLKPGTDLLAFEQKLLSVIDTHLGSQLKKINSQEKFVLQPIKDIHLRSNIRDEAGVNNDYKTVSFLLIISFFIIGIAWLNYINLSNAKATERAREVGVRKVLGSTKNQLVKQFLLESTLLTVLSIIIAAILFAIASPYFNQLIGKEIKFDLAGQATFWAVSIGIIIAGTFLSGLYPAFVISSFNPITAMKGKFSRDISSVRLRQTMVVLQFGVSIFLIIATLTIYLQLDFMRNQELGMNIHEKVVVRAPKIIRADSYLNQMDYFKNKLRTNSKVTYATSSSEVPGKQIFWSNEFRKKSDSENVRKVFNILAVDEDFIKTYDLKLMTGRNFSKERISDLGNTIIVNESALKLLDIKNPEEAIHQELIVGDHEVKTIVGVIKDFHQQSLKQPSSPIIIYYIPWNHDYLTLSIGGDLRSTLATIEKLYEDAFPENAFDYFFLDDQFNQQYRAEERSWKIFILFSSLSIVIACMGLFGLAKFMTMQRSKEIAIRKVLGASVASVTLLLSRDFIKLVLIAFVLAVPVSWLLINQWLQTFAYRIDIAWWTIALAGVLTVLIAFFTVGSQSTKAAIANPIDSIKIE